MTRNIAEASMLRGGGCKWEGGHRQARGIYSRSLTREQGGREKERLISRKPGEEILQQKSLE
jgi:hypothetical protein